MVCGAAFALGKAGEDLQGQAVSVVVAQPCFGRRGPKLPETRAVSPAASARKRRTERKTVRGSRGNFLNQMTLVTGPTRLPGSAVTATARASRRRRRAGDALRGFGVGGGGERRGSATLGECHPGGLVVSPQPRRGCLARRTPSAVLGAAGTVKRPTPRLWPLAPRRAAGSTAPPGANLRRPPHARQRRRGGADGLAYSPLAMARDGRTAIGARRSQWRPAPPRRGFITGIPMAEAGNLLWREGAEPAWGTARAARRRTRRCRAEGRPPARATAGGRRAPPFRLYPVASPRDDGAAGLARRRGSPVPAGAAAAGVSASGSRPPSHGAPGK